MKVGFKYYHVLYKMLEGKQMRMDGVCVFYNLTFWPADRYVVERALCNMHYYKFMWI